MKKYILYGGYVTADDGSHYVSPTELVRLYKLKKEECFLVSSVESRAELRGFDQEFFDSLTELHPKENGIYIT